MTKAKRGRPAGKKASAVVIDGVKIPVENLVENLIDANLQLQIAELQHQIIGYKAVISYLEVQAGLKETQQ